MGKIVAVYEKNFANQWMLKVYHDGRPGKNANGADPIRSAFFDVPEEFLGETINFDGIRKAFPAPIDPIEEKIQIGNEEPKASENSEGSTGRSEPL